MYKKIVYIFRRFKYWLYIRENCSRCCLFCEFYDSCKEDFG